MLHIPIEHDTSQEDESKLPKFSSLQSDSHRNPRIHMSDIKVLPKLQLTEHVYEELDTKNDLAQDMHKYSIELE